MSRTSRRISVVVTVAAMLPLFVLALVGPWRRPAAPSRPVSGPGAEAAERAAGAAYAAPAGPAAADQAAADPSTAPLPHFRPSDDASSMVWELSLHFTGRRQVRIDQPVVRVGKAHILRTAPRQLELELFRRDGSKLRSVNAWHPLRYEAAAVERPTPQGPRLAEAGQAPGGSPPSAAPDDRRMSGPGGADQAPLPPNRLYDPYHIVHEGGDGTLFVPFDPQASSVRIVDWTLGGVELGRVSLEGAARRYCVTAPGSEFCGRRVQAATLYFSPYSTTVGAGEVFTLELRARKVVDFYGGQLAILFDPNILRVVDQDPARPGAQIRPGDFPKPDEVLRNAANNTTGRLEYFFTLTGEKTGPNGTGVVAYLVLRANAPGHSFLAITETVLSDSQSLGIPSKSEMGLVVVEDAPSVMVSGQVELERRPTSAGATVCSPSECVVTDAAGNYHLRALAGRPIAIVHPSYLRAARLIPAASSGSLTLPKVKLLSGDFDKDDRVEIVDAVMIGQRFNVRYNATAPDPRWLKACDITDDNVINILDMVGVQFNMLKTAPVSWTMAAATGRSSGATARADAMPSAPVKVSLIPASANLEAPNGEVSLDLRVDDVENLYGYRVQLRFDPKLLVVKDVSPDESGVQVALGEFLDPLNSFVLMNRADNTAGTVDIGVTQTAPAAGKAGTGILATITFKGRGAGMAEVQMPDAVLVDDTLPIPNTIAAERSGAMITVTGGQPIIYLPHLSKSAMTYNRSMFTHLWSPTSR